MWPMSAFANIPGVIGYMEFHDGPRRVLTIDCQAPSLTAGSYRPIISIDGRSFQVMWGPVSFEIPADRNVHVSGHVMADSMTGFASLLLDPQPFDEQLTYRLRTMSTMGELTRVAPVGY